MKNITVMADIPGIWMTQAAGNVMNSYGESWEALLEMKNVPFLPFRATVVWTLCSSRIVWITVGAQRTSEFIMPVTITKQSLVKKMKERIDLTADNGFADNRMCSVFKYFARPIIDRANHLFSRGGREEAMEAAELMIQMLQELRAEDPAFPEREITLLQDLLERIF